MKTNAEKLLKQYHKIASKFEQELNHAIKLESHAQKLYYRKQSKQTQVLWDAAKQHLEVVKATHDKLHAVSGADRDEPIQFCQTLTIDDPNTYQLLLEDLLIFQSSYDEIKKIRKLRDKELKEAKTPEFFERVCANHVLRPMMAIFLVSSSIMAYTSIIEIASSGMFVLILASAQSLFYFSAERDMNYEYLASLGASIDDFIFSFSLDRLSMKHVYLLLTGIAWFALGLAFATGATTFFPSVLLTTVWPATYQFALYTGVGMFLSKIFFHLINDIYTITISQSYKNRSAWSKLAAGLIYGSFLILVAIAHTIEQLAMLAVVVNVGSTAQLFMAVYGIWFFFTRQISYSDKVDQYMKQLNQLTWSNFLSYRWKILQFVLFTSLTFGLAALILYPPPAIAPAIAQLNLLSIPADTLRLLITIGIASVASLTVISLFAGISDLFFGSAADHIDPIDHLESDITSPDIRTAIYLTSDDLIKNKDLKNSKNVSVSSIPSTSQSNIHTDDNVSMQHTC